MDENSIDTNYYADELYKVIMLNLLFKQTFQK